MRDMMESREILWNNEMFDCENLHESEVTFYIRRHCSFQELESYIIDVAVQISNAVARNGPTKLTFQKSNM